MVNSRTLPQRSDPTSDLLRHRAFPELAEALRGQIGAILDEWKERVRQVLVQRTSGLNTDQLKGSLPEMGAELTVKSELGAGSTFRLALPPEAAGAAGGTPHPHRPEPR